MAKIIAFPPLAIGLGPDERAPLQELARTLCGTWRCEQRRGGERGTELVLIPEEWGNGEAAAFRITRTPPGFTLFDCRRTEGFGRYQSGASEHLGVYADTTDIARVIADLIGTRAPRPAAPRVRIQTHPVVRTPQPEPAAANTVEQPSASA
jgi:hypothetical protein